MPAPRHLRENPSRPDHQDGQPGDPPIAGSRGDVNGLSLDTLEQHSWSLDPRAPATSAGQIGHRGAGKQDRTNCVGVDGAQ